MVKDRRYNQEYMENEELESLKHNKECYVVTREKPTPPKLITEGAKPRPIGRTQD